MICPKRPATIWHWTWKIDLARLINQALADMQEPMDDSGLAFRVNVPDDPVYIASDGKRLYRVFQNLISNTLKYSLLGRGFLST